jgi:hypothetical protein
LEQCTERRGRFLYHITHAPSDAAIDANGRTYRLDASLISLLNYIIRAHQHPRIGNADVIQKRQSVNTVPE